MDLRPESDGNWHVILGPVAKWSMGIAGTLVTIGAVWLFSSVNAMLREQAITNERMATIAAQLAQVPDLGTRVTRLETRVDHISQDVREIKYPDTTRPTSAPPRR